MISWQDKRRSVVQKSKSSLIEQRRQGRVLIFSQLRKSGQLARIDLSKETGLSPATVTTITAEMMEEGLIEEADRAAPTGDAKRGRPRVELKLSSSSCIVAGIKLSKGVMSSVVVDLAGNTLGSLARTFNPATVEADVLAVSVRELLKDLLAPQGLKIEDLSGVGIGVPGIVNKEEGYVYWSPMLTQRNVPLLERLADHLPVPVFIDNDANLVALAELWFGYGRTFDDFIVVTTEHGVGMGIVIDGKVYRGARGCGAELGHTKIIPDGALCRCGQRGCLEAYVADYALLREANIAMPDLPSNSLESRLDQLYRMAQEGHQEAKSIFWRAGKLLALGLANIINVFAPKLIIVAGEQMRLDYLSSDEFTQEVQRNIVYVEGPRPEIVVHRWGDLMWAKGAAAFALSECMNASL
ncbi:ROK family transcriptional regulator [Pseudovibrio sp. SPO723]|uniref:ROK family transcriptional regulator n=1 Tax=Nesiotobacter zosterae TaxID=392721 RepID=UPI0029C4534F|nr:ROK family transcriptional regulator [Pseudovibrio sp. SPO723]MDX5595178.1 ROK family transcriptional regulator [Pseudovibrio sp. SPO723]